MKKPAATGLNFILRVGWWLKDIFPLLGAVGPDGLRQAQRGQLKLDEGHPCVGTNDCIRRIIMPRLGLSIRAYRAGAAEMELMESRRPGEAWARHCGARVGVFGEAGAGRQRR